MSVDIKSILNEDIDSGAKAGVFSGFDPDKVNAAISSMNGNINSIGSAINKAQAIASKLSKLNDGVSGIQPIISSLSLAYSDGVNAKNGIASVYVSTCNLLGVEAAAIDSIFDNSSGSGNSKLTADEMIKNGYLDGVFKFDEDGEFEEYTDRDKAINAVADIVNQHMLSNGYTIDKDHNIYDKNGNKVSLENLRDEITSNLSESDKYKFEQAFWLTDAFIANNIREKQGVEERGILEEFTAPLVSAGASIMNGVVAFSSGFYDAADSAGDWFNSNITANLWYGARWIGSKFDSSIDPNYAYDQMGKIVSCDVKEGYLENTYATGWGQWSEKNAIDLLKKDGGLGFGIIQGLGTVGFNATLSAATGGVAGGTTAAKSYLPVVSFFTGSGRTIENELNMRVTDGKYSKVLPKANAMGNLSGLKEMGQNYLGSQIIPGIGGEGVAGSVLRVGVNGVVNATDAPLDALFASTIYGEDFNLEKYGGTNAVVVGTAIGVFGDIVGELSNYGKGRQNIQQNGKNINYDEAFEGNPFYDGNAAANLYSDDPNHWGVEALAKKIGIGNEEALKNAFPGKKYEVVGNKVIVNGPTGEVTYDMTYDGKYVIVPDIAASPRNIIKNDADSLQAYAKSHNYTRYEEVDINGKKSVKFYNQDGNYTTYNVASNGENVITNVTGKPVYYSYANGDVLLAADVATEDLIAKVDNCSNVLAKTKGIVERKYGDIIDPDVLNKPSIVFMTPAEDFEEFSYNIGVANVNPGANGYHKNTGTGKTLIVYKDNVDDVIISHEDLHSKDYAGGEGLDNELQKSNAVANVAQNYTATYNITTNGYMEATNEMLARTVAAEIEGIDIKDVVSDTLYDDGTRLLIDLCEEGDKKGWNLTDKLIASSIELGNNRFGSSKSFAATQDAYDTLTKALGGDVDLMAKTICNIGGVTEHCFSDHDACIQKVRDAINQMVPKE